MGMLVLRRLLLRFRALPPTQKVIVTFPALLGVLWFLASTSSERYVLPVEHTCRDPPEIISHPLPLIVMVGGGARTGTTYVYNLVRILLRQRDPNTISGWYEDLSYAAARYASPDPPTSPVTDGTREDNYNVWNGALDAYKDTGTTVLVKVHSLAHATRLFSGCDGNDEIMADSCPVDLVGFTHRDVGPQVASIRRMGWARQLSKTELNDGFELCRKRRDPVIKAQPRLTYGEWSKTETWVEQAQALATCHTEWLKAVGPKKLAVDVKMEGTLDADIEAKVKLAQQIIQKIGQLTNSKSAILMDAEAAVEEADKLRPLSCSSWQAVNPITHMHRGHVSSNDASTNEADPARERGLAAIAADPTLKKWRLDLTG